jgi:hypothetical protein
MREELNAVCLLWRNDDANQVMKKNKAKPTAIPVLARYTSFTIKEVAKWFKSGGGDTMGMLNDNQTPARRQAPI